MNEPLCSVLSITYNHAPYIAQAIESFLAQETTFPFEIVIGEDCSTDGTREIVFDYAKRHPEIIRVVTSDKNVGIVPNFLRTFWACRGKYIAFCEGDDFWQQPKKLQIQTDFLQRNADYGMCHSDYDEIDEVTGHVAEARLRSSGTVHQTDEISVEMVLLGEYPMATATMFMRRSMIESIISNDPKSFDGRHVMADLQLRAGAAFHGKIKTIPLSTATYRRVHVSATRSPNFKNQLQLTESHYDAMMHLSCRYSCAKSVQELLHRKWASRLLRTAFLAADMDAAKRAVARFKNEGLCLPWSAHVCWLAMNWSVVGSLLHFIVALRRFSRNELLSFWFNPR